MDISLVPSEISSVIWEWKIKYFLETYQPCPKWPNIMISINRLLKKQKTFLYSKKNKEKLLLLKKNNQHSESYMMISDKKSVSKMLSESSSRVSSTSAIGLKDFKSKSPKNFIKKSSLPIKRFFKSLVSKECMFSRKAKSRFMPTGHQDTKSTSRKYWGSSSQMRRWRFRTTFTGTLSWCQIRP